MSSTTIHCPCRTNLDEIRVDRLTEIRSLPFLDITYPVSNIQYLSNVDIDKHMPSDTNFGYYTPHDFHSSNDFIECLSNDKAFPALHCNIRRLSANLDNLLYMLSELNHSFPLTRLSETKISHDKDLHVNVNLTGYDLSLNQAIPMQVGLLFILITISTTSLDQNLQNLPMILKLYGLN